MVVWWCGGYEWRPILVFSDSEVKIVYKISPAADMGGGGCIDCCQ